MSANSDGTYDIKYTDGIKESRVERDMIKVDDDGDIFSRGGASKSPTKRERPRSPGYRSSSRFSGSMRGID